MRKTSLYISGGLHAAVFLCAMFGLPMVKKDLAIPPPITVDLVEVSKITQTNQVAPQPAPVEEKKPEPPKPAPPPPPPSPPPPEKVEPLAPIKEDVKEETKKPAEELPPDENVLPKPEKKKEKAKKKEEKKKEEKKKDPPKPQHDFSSVLRNLEKQDDTPPPKETPAKQELNADEPTSTKGVNAPLGEKLTISEEDALRTQLEKCWNVPVGAKDAENLSVDIFMVINPDRTLQSARIVDMKRYNDDSFYRAAADSAVRAVRSPLCSPFQLPPDKYETWRETTVTFNPRDMF